MKRKALYKFYWSKSLSSDIEIKSQKGQVKVHFQMSVQIRSHPSHGSLRWFSRRDLDIWTLRHFTLHSKGFIYIYN